jgi:ribosomal protein L37AE/L43A
LCECETSLEASELSEALKQAGIESWIENPATRSRYTGLGLSYPRVLVAADQLEQARAIAARPIPSEIVEATETEVPDFQAPSCPKCGAGDPVLEGVNPANTWRCEQCGQQWTETAPAEAPKTS